MNSTDYAAALVAGELQYMHVQRTLDVAVNQARELLGEYSDVEVWALVGVTIAKQLDCNDQRQQFACEVVAAAVIRIAKSAL
jgi:hypothetical protein